MSGSFCGTRLLVLVALSAVVSHASAQRAGAVTLFVGFAAGSGTDIAARMIGDHMKDAFGRPVVVINKPGAGGRVAAEQFMHATPDGSAVLIAPLFAMVLAPLTVKNLDYSPVRDFVPIAQIIQFEFGLAVGAEHPARNLREFVEWARANPLRANFGSLATGGLPHFLGVEFSREVGIDMVHAAYNGPVELEKDLLGGHVSSEIDALPNLFALHRAGKIRILATSGTTRSWLCPDVPTFSELGMPAIRASSWIAAYAPAGTPKDTVNALSREIKTALGAPDVKAKFDTFGFEGVGTTPEELAAIMAADTARWAPIVKAAGFHAN